MNPAGTTGHSVAIHAWSFTLLSAFQLMTSPEAIAPSWQCPPEHLPPRSYSLSVSYTLPTHAEADWLAKKVRDFTKEPSPLLSQPPQFLAISHIDILLKLTPTYTPLNYPLERQQLPTLTLFPLSLIQHPKKTENFTLSLRARIGVFTNRYSRLYQDLSAFSCLPCLGTSRAVESVERFITSPAFKSEVSALCDVLKRWLICKLIIRSDLESS